MERTDVAVVGAGLAGLTASRDLIAEGLSVVVLEARDRVGGRILNHTFSNGVVVELGGQWVGPTQDRVLALAAELGVELFPTYDTGEGLLFIAGEVKRFDDEGFGLPHEAREEVVLTQKALDEMALTVPLDAPWTAADARRWDHQTVETWIEDNVTIPEAEDFWRLLVEAVFAAEPWDISLLHFLFYLHSGGLIDRLITTANGPSPPLSKGVAEPPRRTEGRGCGPLRSTSSITGFAISSMSLSSLRRTPTSRPP